MPISSFWNNIVSKLYIGKSSEFFNWKNITSNSTDYSLNPELLSTIFTCWKIRSETLGKIPCNLIQYSGSEKAQLINDNLYYLLRYAPNDYMTPFTFWGTLEAHNCKYGNSYSIITRDNNGYPTSLDIVHPDNVISIFIKDNSLYYKIKDANGDIIVKKDDDILHFKGFTLDGLYGVNPMDALKQNLNILGTSYDTIEKFHRNNIFSTKYIKSTALSNNSLILEEQTKRLNELNAGSEKSGTMYVLPPNTEIQNSPLNLIDVQFIDTIKYISNQIVSLYGLSPNVIGDYTATKFNDIEQMQLNFKATTVQNMTEIYETELNYKLLTRKQKLDGYSIEFDVNILIEYDLDTKMRLWNDLFNKGVISQNQLASLNNFPTFEGGDNHYIMGNNYTLLENIIKDMVNGKEDIKKNINKDGNN